MPFPSGLAPFGAIWEVETPILLPLLLVAPHCASL